MASSKIDNKGDNEMKKKPGPKKGYKQTKEHRMNISKANKGLTKSDETKKKISESQFGNKNARSFYKELLINYEQEKICIMKQILQIEKLKDSTKELNEWLDCLKKKQESLSISIEWVKKNKSKLKGTKLLKENIYNNSAEYPTPIGIKIVEFDEDKIGILT